MREFTLESRARLHGPASGKFQKQTADFTDHTDINEVRKTKLSSVDPSSLNSSFSVVYYLLLFTSGVRVIREIRGFLLALIRVHP
jgi:hypothetical protein